MSQKPYYVTTTIPYVNADPHVGFALEVVQADVFARDKRAAGHEVFFSCGTDEHGQKIWDNARERDQSAQEYVDHYADRFKQLRDKLDLSYDSFIRTTDPHHIEAAREMWRRCSQNGYIYKANYQSKYCIGCELEKQDSDLDEHGNCPLHPNKALELRDEENYFFSFSKLQKQLQTLWSRDDFVVPDFRLNEMRSLAENEGLKDFSISRLASKMPWGVPVPEDPEHVMYVWFDAFVNYISTLDWPDNTEQFSQFWNGETNIQFAGKDQVRQQAAMWQAMLIAADLPGTAKIFIHGFIQSNGQKMSKSIGNVVEPYSLVEKYGTDALRYYLLRHIHPTEDSDFTIEKFHEAYMASLVNGLGNLVSRVLNMADKYGVSLEQGVIAEDLLLIEQFRFNDHMDAVWKLIQNADQFISEEQPFKKAKDDLSAAQDDLRYLLGQLWIINQHLVSVMPETHEKIARAIKNNKKPDEPLFPRIEFNK